MTGEAYECAQLSELEHESGWAPVRKHFGIQSFGVNAWTARETDARLIPEHDEKPSGHEELYIVVSGHATFSVGGDEIDAPVGTMILVRDPEVRRGAVPREPGTTVLSAGAKPGEAYRPRAWETNEEVIALLDSGDYAGAKRVLLGALDTYEDEAAVFYNLACAEALLGESDAALEHLRAAVAQRPEFGQSAAGDEDLAPLRADPRFAEVVGGP